MNYTRRLYRRLWKTLFVLLTLAVLNGAAAAHPLGNFTINHFVRLEVGGTQVNARFVVDMAEIATLQELQSYDADGDGIPSQNELDAYLTHTLSQYVNNLRLTVDGARVPLNVTAKQITAQEGSGGLPTLRLVCDLTGALPATGVDAGRKLNFEDANHPDRLGWRELVVVPAGVSIYNTNAYGNAVTDELKAYPQDSLSAPLDERRTELSFKLGLAPAGATAVRMRADNSSSNQQTNTAAINESATAVWFSQKPDRLTALIALPQLTPLIALFALLIAAALGALHALSPGHGKTVVGAYLVGSRGTAKHAAFLGLTVTITHTVGVFALGLITLFAAQYILPERLFPILSFVSGAIVLFIGLNLFVRRLRTALGGAVHSHGHAHGIHAAEAHAHSQPHSHDQGNARAHEHAHGHDLVEHADGSHSHGGSTHTHLPPGADGVPVTWRSLLALGISGGLLPCPSALVVLLAAIAKGRVGFGLVLVIAFSFGLACTLTGIGLAFVYAGRMMKRRATAAGPLVQIMPALSAFVIMCVGAVVCYEALTQTGLLAGLRGSFTGLFMSRNAAPGAQLSIAGVLALGLVFGLKHAVEADHLAAVSTIVSERASILSSSLVGALWGLGHTISLLVAGVVVILLHIQIGERVASMLEFGVALMLIALGANALRKLYGGKLHFHIHRHGEHAHLHPHTHAGQPEREPQTHHGYRLNARPVLIGMAHGLAGSAALMLLVLSTIPSPGIGLVYILVFGVGSVGGMMLMSAMVGLPLRLTARRFTRMNVALRGLAGVFSFCFGVFMAYQIGFAGGLFR